MLPSCQPLPNSPHSSSDSRNQSQMSEFQLFDNWLRIRTEQVASAVAEGPAPILEQWATWKLQN